MKNKMEVVREGTKVSLVFFLDDDREAILMYEKLNKSAVTGTLTLRVDTLEIDGAAKE